MPVSDASDGQQGHPARFGATLYAIKVSRDVDPDGVIYHYADSISVPATGALVLTVEMPTPEDLRKNEFNVPTTIHEYPVTLVIAPGQWVSCMETHRELTPDGPLYIPYRTAEGYLETWTDLPEEVDGDRDTQGCAASGSLPQNSVFTPEEEAALERIREESRRAQVTEQPASKVPAPDDGTAPRKRHRRRRKGETEATDG